MNKKKVLHISHHRGCFRDQQYVLEKLGFEITNYKFTDNLFTITKDIANQFWDYNKEIFNTFDYILISDTAPLSRTFLQHIEELKPKLVIWVCNRFDWAMQSEPDYYDLFRNTYNHHNVRVIPSTFFEKIWCMQHGINIMYTDVINPLGKISVESEQNIPKSNVFEEWYESHKEVSNADVIVPFYRNDNVFFKMADYLRERGVSVYNGTFSNPSELKKFKAYITLPDQFCKWFSFEIIHQNVPVILPSKKLLYKLSKEPNYLFSINGYGGAEYLTDDIINLCEWYNPKFTSCRFYFDDFEELPDLIKSIGPCNFNKESTEHENDVLEKWRKVYESF